MLVLLQAGGLWSVILKRNTALICAAFSWWSKACILGLLSFLGTLGASAKSPSDFENQWEGYGIRVQWVSLGMSLVDRGGNWSVTY